MGNASFPFEVVPGNEVTVVRFSQKSINATNLDVIAQALYDLVKERCPKNALLNLAPVQFLFSDVLEVILRLHKQLQDGHGKLSLCNLQPTVQEVILTTRLDQIMGIYGTEEAALKDLGETAQ